MATETAIEKMPSSISGLRDTAKTYFAKWQSARNSAQRVAKENEQRIEGVIQTVETVGAAWAVSYWNAKSGPSAGMPYQVMGYDSDLVVGAALVGLGLFELAGKYDEHLYALGAGALSAWATREGWAQGGKARTTTTATATATAAPAATTTGVSPAGAYVSGVAPAGQYQG
jgi:hypothetical protein